MKAYVYSYMKDRLNEVLMDLRANKKLDVECSCIEDTKEFEFCELECSDEDVSLIEADGRINILVPQ